MEEDGGTVKSAEVVKKNVEEVVGEESGNVLVKEVVEEAVETE